MVRTGIVAMRRGKRNSAPGAPLEVMHEISPVADDESMSV